MRTVDLVIPAVDDLPLRGYAWLPQQDPPRSVVLVVHGMAEHCARYARFAEQLTQAGHAVYGYDQRGHGRTAVENGQQLGHFGDRHGWELILSDLAAVRQAVAREHPGLPVFLFGHSMGSLLVRAYLQRDAAGLAGAILCGTAGDPGPARLAGLALARTQARLHGRRTPSVLLDRLLFGTFNAPFAAPGAVGTGFEWLSRDHTEVTSYVADPWCGYVCSAQFYADLLAGIAAVHDQRRISAVPRDLPLLFVAGAHDPVGDRWRGVLTSKAQFQRAGLRDVRSILYPGARHEILNDSCRDQVTQDVLAWLDEHRTGND